MEEITKQKVLVRGLLIHDGRALLLRRPAHKRHNPGLYELPGGKVDLGEHPLDALRREFLEETGLRAEVGALIHVGSYVSHEVHAIELVYRMNVEDVTPFRISDEHTEAVWATLDGQGLPMIQSCKDVLSQASLELDAPGN